MSSRVRNRNIGKNLYGLNLKKSNRKSSKSTPSSKKGNNGVTETTVKLFNFVGGLLMSILKKKRNSKLGLTNNEDEIIKHLKKLLNKSTIDKENVRTLLKVLQANPLLRVKNPFKKDKVKSSNNKRGGALSRNSTSSSSPVRRNSTSSPVRSLPQLSESYYTGRYNVNQDPIILRMEEQQRMLNYALVGCVFTLICYGISSLF